MKKDKLGKILKIALDIVRELFVVSLIFYLVLFILETVFPGFVSNNFDLNWVLGGVLVLGLISVFAPDKPRKQGKDSVTLFDYVFVVALGIVGGGLIFYKVEVEGYIRWIIAIVSGLLVVILGLVVLVGEEEAEDVDSHDSESFESFNPKSLLRYFKTVSKSVFSKKVNLPVVFVLIFLVFTGFLIHKNFIVFTNFVKKPKVVEIILTPTPIPTLIPTPTPKLVRPSQEILIRVLNGGAEKGGAGRFVKILKEEGFAQTIAGEADNYNYENAVIKFKPEDKEQADLIKNLLKNEYSLVVEAPLSTESAEIIVVLGAVESAVLAE